jgi:heme/copper-type cytochrome/quinol oxidase subunit 4
MKETLWIIFTALVAIMLELSMYIRLKSDTGDKVKIVDIIVIVVSNVVIAVVVFKLLNALGMWFSTYIGR